MGNYDCESWLPPSYTDDYFDRLFDPSSSIGSGGRRKKRRHTRSYTSDDQSYLFDPSSITLSENRPKKRRHERSCPPQPPHTEFHEALTSFGVRDRTNRLSDTEFASQYVGELAYCANKCGYYFAEAVTSFARAFFRLFG